MSEGILSEPKVYAVHRRHFGWRNIASALNDPKSGEEKPKVVTSPVAVEKLFFRDSERKIRL